MIDSSVREWAAERLAQLGARLSTDDSEAAEFHRAGVNPRRIAILYPFDISSGWIYGTFELAPPGAELEPGSVQQALREPLDFYTGALQEVASTLSFDRDAPGFAELSQALHDSRNPSSISRDADALRLLILTLHALTLKGVVLQSRPTFAVLWDRNFPDFKLLVDGLVETLAAHRWVAQALRGEDA